MSNLRWRERSGGGHRSKLLLDLDLALMNYNAAQHEKSKIRMDRLTDLRSAFNTYLKSKPQVPNKGIRTKRAKSLKELHDQVSNEIKALKSAPLAGTVDSSKDVRSIAADVNRRAIHVVQDIVSGRLKATPTEGLSFLATLKGEANTLKTSAQARKDSADKHAARAAKKPARNSDPRYGAALHAAVLVEAVDTYSSIVRIGAANDDKKLADLKTDLDALSGSSAKIAITFIGEVRGARDLLEAVKGVGGKPGAFLDDDRLELLDQMSAFFEGSMDITGAHRGTEGKGNEGIDSYKTALGETKSSDTVSGTADITGAIAGLGGDAVSLWKAIKKWRDPDSSPADKAAAALAIAQAPLSMLSNIGKLTGGAFTAHKGIKTHDTSGMFGFTKEGKGSGGGADASTDVKFLGDLVGVAGGMLSSIAKVIDLVMHSRTKKEQGQGVKSKRKDAESAGVVLQKGTGVLVGLANNTKAVMKLHYQVQGGGQVVTDALSEAAKAFMGKIVPALNLLTALLETGRLVYKVVRLGKHRGKLTAKIARLMGSTRADLRMVEAVEFAHLAVNKRMNRIGISIAHEVTSIAGGIVTLTGIGMAPAMIMSIVSTAGKLGQVGVRVVTQKGRDIKAKHRAKKDANKRGGKSETYEHFKLRKRMEASGGNVFDRFRTATMLSFKFNWDKSSANKKSNTTAVALEMLRMNDKDIFKAMGISVALNNETAEAERLKIVVGALKKRD